MGACRAIIICNSYQVQSLPSLAGPPCDGELVKAWLTASLGVEDTTGAAVRITIHEDQDGDKMQGIFKSLARKLSRLPDGKRKPLVCSIETLSHVSLLVPHAACPFTYLFRSNITQALFGARRARGDTSL